MSENTFGTRLYIDYTDFKTGIAEANRLIKLNEQQFKTASEGMDDWSKTSEGLNAKLQSLSRTIELQKQNVSAMEREYESIKNQYGENSREAQNFALKLEKEKTALAKSEKEQRKYSKALEDVEAESKDAQKGLLGFIKSLGKTEEATENASEKAEGLGASFKTLVGANLVSGAISGLASSLGGLVSSFFQASEATKEYRMNMAKVEQTALSMGESFDNAKENMLDMASVSGDLEATGEAINNLLASGIKGDNLDKISKQLTGASIKWKDTLKLEGLADGLQETLATNNAIGPFAELLERGGQNLESFNAQLKACSSEAEKQNLVMSYLSKMGLEDIADGYYNANKNMIEAEKAQLRYNDTMAQVGSIMEPINTFFTNLKTNLLQNFLPSLKTISQGFVDLTNGVKGATNTIASGFMSMIKSIGQRIATIGQQIIASALKIIPDLLSKLTQALPLVVSLISDYLNLALLTMTEKAPDFMQGATDFFGGLVSAFFEISNELVDSLPSLLTNIFAFLGEGVPQVLEFSKQLFTGLIDGFISVIGNLKENLPLIIEAVQEGLQSFLPKVVDGASNLFNGVLDGLKKLIPELVDSLPIILENIISFLKGAIPTVLENAFELFKNIVTGLIKFIPVLVENLPKITLAIVNGILDLAFMLVNLGKDLVIKIKDGIVENISEMKNVGKNLLEGLTQGMKDNINNVVEGAKKLGDKVVNGFKDIFGIHSPSTVMAEQGDYLMQGLANGMTENQGQVLQASEKVGANTIEGLKASIEEKQGQLAEILGLTFVQASENAQGQVQEGANIVASTFVDTVNDTLANSDLSTNLTGATDDFKSGLENALTSVFSKENFKGILEGDWSGFVNSLGDSLASGLGSAIGGAIGGPWGAVVGNLVGGVVDWIIDGITSLFKKEEEKPTTNTSTKTSSSSGSKKSKSFYSFSDNSLQGVSGAISNVSSVMQADRERVTQIINFSQTNTSPKALSTAEIYRQTNRAVNLLGVKSYV